LREVPERTLSAIQVGMTLMGMVSGAAGGAGAQEVLTPFLESQFALGAGTAKAVAIVVVAIPLMFATVVIGELVPKAFALRHPEDITLLASGGSLCSNASSSPWSPHVYEEARSRNAHPFAKTTHRRHPCMDTCAELVDPLNVACGM
jgi:hypothetical protein